MSKKVKDIIKVVVVVLALEIVCAAIIFIPNINISKGQIGEQQVTAIQFFDKLIVADEERNERYFYGVRSFDFVVDRLIINKIRDEDKQETLQRTKMSFKNSSGKNVTAVYDFTKVTLMYEDGKEIPYSNVKTLAFGKDYRQLYMLFFNGENWQLLINKE